MKIHALTVCVDYSDELRLSLPRWRPLLQSYTIVTDTKDEATAALAEEHGCRLHRTDVFYANDAYFNKGAAMEEARKLMPWEDWIIFVDADIVPPVNWYHVVVTARPKPGILYSAWRHQCSDASRLDDDWPKINGDGLGVGYFQLFHTSDPRVQDQDLIETHWAHAGNYDNAFMHRWPHTLRAALPMKLIHLGEKDNWFGKHDKETHRKMRAERNRRNGRWDHEVVGFRWS